MVIGEQFILELEAAWDVSGRLWSHTLLVRWAVEGCQDDLHLASGSGVEIGSENFHDHAGPRRWSDFGVAGSRIVVVVISTSVVDDGEEGDGAFMENRVVRSYGFVLRRQSWR